MLCDELSCAIRCLGGPVVVMSTAISFRVGVFMITGVHLTSVMIVMLLVNVSEKVVNPVRL